MADKGKRVIITTTLIVDVDYADYGCDEGDDDALVQEVQADFPATPDTYFDTSQESSVSVLIAPK